VPTVDRLDVCNKAISRIRAKRIATFEEASLEARECRTFYPAVVGFMLDGPYDHDFSFANQRVILAEKATNDRLQEWSYAYALPSNMSSPIRVIPDLESAGLSLPVPLPGDPYAETWALTGSYIETPYLIEGDTLYTHGA
jgi:hypothetical protein